MKKSNRKCLALFVSIFILTGGIGSGCSAISDFADYRFAETPDGGGTLPGDGGPAGSGDAATEDPSTGDAATAEDAATGGDAAETCTPSGPEICDGEDNDCDPDTADGAEEEGFGDACDGVDDDLCADGVLVCDGSALVCDDDADSIPELCDGEDNDCNTDTADGSAEPGIGDDCDGDDDDLCPDGKLVCNGSAVVCNDDAAVIPELCDGEDNDCNTDTPDGAHESDFDNPCDGDDDDLCPDGVMVCNGTDMVCNDDADSIPELCDGEDNDCNPDTPDGAHEDTLSNPCDGPDADFCLEGEIICNNEGALVCTDTSGGTKEICNNGSDEDCDGHAQICLPALNGEFPGQNGVAAAVEVKFDFNDPGGTWTAMCRTGKPDTVNSLSWQSCASSDNLPVMPFSPAQSQSAALNGVAVTQVRFEWNNGDVTTALQRRFYLHNSLHGVAFCPPVDADLQALYFEKAAERLIRDDTPIFDTSSDLQLLSPFIQIRFAPLIDGSFQISDGDGKIELLSLRRRFVLESERRQLLLMYRLYESRRGVGCRALTTHRHTGTTRESGDIYWHYYNDCDAVVLNKQGAGVCLRYNGGNPAFATDPRGIALNKHSGLHVPFEQYYCAGGAYNQFCADNLLWRKLARRRGGPNGPMRYFSPKCFGAPDCAGPGVLYLPDRDLFNDVFP